MMTHCFLCKKRGEIPKGLDVHWVCMLHDKKSQSQVTSPTKPQSFLFLIKQCVAPAWELRPEVPALGKRTGEDRSGLKSGWATQCLQSQNKNKPQNKSGTVAHTYSPNMQEVEAVRSGVSRPAWATKTLSQNKTGCKGRGLTRAPFCTEYRANRHSGLELLYAREVNSFCQDYNKAVTR